MQKHLPSEELWGEFGKFAAWKLAGAAYLAACRKSVEAVVEKCEELTGCKVLSPAGNWPQEGIFWGFPKTIHEHVASQAEHGPGPTIPKFDYEREQAQSKVGEQGLLHVLRYGGVSGIACHQDSAILERWRRIHGKLMDRGDFLRGARSLVAMHRRLEESAQPIRDTLRFEIERGRFDRGGCDSCASI